MTLHNEMTGAQRLALAAAEAPILRNASEKTLARRVALVDKDGNVTGYTSGREVLKGLARVQELEHAVEGRPKTVVCKNCGKSLKVGRSKIPLVCRQGCERTCSVVGCNNTVSESAAQQAAYRSARPRCRWCAAKSTQNRTREIRSARAQKWKRAMPDPPWWAEAKALRDIGWTLQDIAEKFEKSTATVHNAIVRRKCLDTKAATR